MRLAQGGKSLKSIPRYSIFQDMHQSLALLQDHPSPFLQTSILKLNSMKENYARFREDISLSVWAKSLFYLWSCVIGQQSRPISHAKKRYEGQVTSTQIGRKGLASSLQNVNNLLNLGSILEGIYCNSFKYTHAHGYYIQLGALSR